MDRFSKMHPVLEFTFFICVFLLSVSLSNPLFVLPSLVLGIGYDLLLRGKTAFSNLWLTLTIVFVVSLFNFIFAHYGVTLLFEINGVRFTAEALLYGVYQGGLLSAMLIWFAVFSRNVDSEKVIYVFRFAPKCALIFSMVLGFIPRFRTKLEDIQNARIGLYGGKNENGRRAKLKNALSDLSALITYSLESSIVTSDSMQARGYNPHAVRHSRYEMKPIDLILTVSTLLAFGYVLYGKISGKITFIMNPQIYSKTFDASVMIVYCLLFAMPIIVDLFEEIRWKVSALKK